MRVRRRLRVASLRALRLVGRHYVSLTSGLVLSVAATLALTSASFDPPERLGSAASQSLPGAQAAPAPTATPIWSPAPPRRLALIYLVMDEEEGAAILRAHNSLMWDTHHVDPDAYARASGISYLVAGTPETEAQAITSLNAYAEIAQMRQVDLRVVDLRPDRRPAAIPAPP